MKELNDINIFEYIDTAKVNLREEDFEYKNQLREISKLKENYPKISSFLEENEITEITKEECEILRKILSLYNETGEKEEEKIFLCGCKQAYLYFKSIGIIE